MSGPPPSVPTPGWNSAVGDVQAVRLSQPRDAGTAFSLLGRTEIRCVAARPGEPACRILTLTNRHRAIAPTEGAASCSGILWHMDASTRQGLGSSSPLRCGIVLRVHEAACEIFGEGRLRSVGYARQFPSPRTERVSPGHLVAVATATDGSEVVVWRWYDAVVLGEEAGRPGCGSPRTTKSLLSAARSSNDVPELGPTCPPVCPGRTGGWLALPRPRQRMPTSNWTRLSVSATNTTSGTIWSEVRIRSAERPTPVTCPRRSSPGTSAGRTGALWPLPRRSGAGTQRASEPVCWEIGPAVICRVVP